MQNTTLMLFSLQCRLLSFRPRSTSLVMASGLASCPTSHHQRNRLPRNLPLRHLPTSHRRPTSHHRPRNRLHHHYQSSSSQESSSSSFHQSSSSQESSSSFHQS